MTSLEYVLIFLVIILCFLLVLSIVNYNNIKKDLTDYLEISRFIGNLYYGRCINWKNAIKIHEQESQRFGLYDEIEQVFIDLEKED